MIINIYIVLQLFRYIFVYNAPNTYPEYKRKQNNNKCKGSKTSNKECLCDHVYVSCIFVKEYEKSMSHVARKAQTDYLH